MVQNGIHSLMLLVFSLLLTSPGFAQPAPTAPAANGAGVPPVVQPGTTANAVDPVQAIKPKQDLAPAQNAGEKKATAPVKQPSAGYQKPTTFVPSERLENMRYRHLWLAYAFVWLFVFLFIFRTWQMNQKTTEELAQVRAKLAALEAKDGDA